MDFQSDLLLGQTASEVERKKWTYPPLVEFWRQKLEQYCTCPVRTNPLQIRK